MSETLEGRAVLIGPAGRHVLTLNPVGSAVWDLLAQPATDDELAERLGARFADVDAARVATDVRTFLAELKSEGLVEVS